MTELTCDQRIDVELEKVKQDIELYFNDSDIFEEGSNDPEMPPFHDYALGFDYVEPGTFNNQQCGYYRYQLSYGGPSDEIRFFPNGVIEYWFLDWFDGASRDVTKEDWAVRLREEFEELGSIDWTAVKLY